MYKHFIRNLNNYLELNIGGLSNDEFRMRSVECLKALSDIGTYHAWKECNPEKYKEVCHIIYEIEQNKKRYHSFETFAWELWGYGYDGKKNNEYSKEMVEEQLKMIDLLLGTHYWI
jgi:hypothetical protein